jgi:hypothetical protein
LILIMQIIQNILFYRSLLKHPFLQSKLIIFTFLLTFSSGLSDFIPIKINLSISIEVNCALD